MYVPKINQVSDRTEILQFIGRYNFATVVSSGKELIASHIPIEYRVQDEIILLRGHLAKANPQWKSFREDENIMVIFMESHAYISPSWYEKVDVPTWNYIAIHMYGKPRLLEVEELKHFVFSQMQKYESGIDHPVQIDDLNPETLKRNLRGIIGFEMKVDDIQARYKLSQNKSDTTIRNIIRQLKIQADENAHKIADAMQHLKK